MELNYNFSAESLNQMLTDMQKEYDPRDVAMAGALASAAVYILRFTDTVEAAVDTSTDLLKTLAAQAAGNEGLGGAGGITSLVGLLGLVPK